MDFLYGPNEAGEPDGFEPLDLDDEEYDEDEDPYEYFEEPYEEEEYEEYEEPGLGGFDDLKPFTSFNDMSSWDDGFL